MIPLVTCAYSSIHMSRTQGTQVEFLEYAGWATAAATYL